MSQEKATLLYFGDPMCSWCYGFSPEFSKAIKALEGEVNVELVMGGLRPYNTQTMTELGDFLQHHWEEVGQRSGQQFKYDILKDASFVYDTEPACRAVTTIRELKPEVEFEFFKAIQKAFYFENKNTSDLTTYTDLSDQFGFEKTAFAEIFESAAMKVKVKKDFEKSATMGVRGFPTVILKKGEKVILISNGYAEAEQVIDKVNLFLQE